MCVACRCASARARGLVAGAAADAGERDTCAAARVRVMRRRRWPAAGFVARRPASVGDAEAEPARVPRCVGHTEGRGAPVSPDAPDWPASAETRHPLPETFSPRVVCVGGGGVAVVAIAGCAVVSCALSRSACAPSARHRGRLAPQLLTEVMICWLPASAGRLVASCDATVVALPQARVVLGCCAIVMNRRCASRGLPESCFVARGSSHTSDTGFTAAT